MAFAVGTKVMLSEQGVLYWSFSWNDYFNPPNTIGTIIEPQEWWDGSDFTDRVQWPTGNTNSYKPGDLVEVIIN